MTVSAVTFLTRFSEFQPQSEAMIAACLRQADAETDVTAWGDLHDDATYWLAAHLIAIRVREIGMFTGATPASQYGGVGGKGSSNTPYNQYGLTATLYGQEFLRLEQSRLYSTTGFVV